MPPFPALSPCGLLPLQLREVLNAGLRLPVDIPEIEELRLEVKRREWEDSARRSLGARQHNTLAFLSELVASAVEVGVESTPMAAGLRWVPVGAFRSTLLNFLQLCTTGTMADRCCAA